MYLFFHFTQTYRVTFALTARRISGWSLGNCTEVEGADRKIEFVLHGERNDASPSVHLDWVFSELCVHIYTQMSCNIKEFKST